MRKKESSSESTETFPSLVHSINQQINLIILQSRTIKQEFTEWSFTLQTYVNRSIYEDICLSLGKKNFQKKNKLA